VDGTDPVESYAAFTRAVKHCRSGQGPAFVHGHVIRQYSHSFSDDEGLYRSEAERKREAALDPLPKLQMRLLRDGILDPAAINVWNKKSTKRCEARPKKCSAQRCPRLGHQAACVFRRPGSDERKSGPAGVQTPDAQERTMPT